MGLKANLFVFHSCRYPRQESKLISPEASNKNRLWLMVTISALSLTLTSAAGWYYWESLWLGILGLWPLLKTSLSGKTLWIFLKKTPWLLLAGFKKYALKLFAAIMSVQLGSRFRWVQKLVQRVRSVIARTTELLTSQWNTLNFIEKALVLFFSTQLVILLFFVLILSKSLQLLAIKSGSETTAEQVLKRSMPKTLREKLNQFGQRKAKIAGKKGDK